jgi:hypothetical protein
MADHTCSCNKYKTDFNLKKLNEHECKNKINNLEIVNVKKKSISRLIKKESKK